MSALQDNIEFDGSQLRGTLKYVTGYTGYSGDPSEQDGNFLALQMDTSFTAEKITVELVNGKVGHPVELDSDKNIVIRITNKDTQYIEVVAYAADGRTKTKTYYLTNLTLETE